MPVCECGKETYYIVDRPGEFKHEGACYATKEVNPKPVGDFRKMAEAISAPIGMHLQCGQVHMELSRIIEQALSRVAAETEARVRAETIEECAKVCDSDSESTEPVTRYYGNVIAKLIRALASNSSREGEK